VSTRPIAAALDLSFAIVQVQDSYNHLVTDFLDRLATQLKSGKSAACRRAVQRILALMRKDYEAGRYKTRPEAETEFRKLVEREESCK
jgi:hypothetical protein